MFTLEAIKHTHSQVKSGADFPVYIQDMKKLGVISYEVSLRDGKVCYFGLNNFRIDELTGIDPLEIDFKLNIEQFRSDLRNHQDGNTDYLTFCSDCAKSGIAGWNMNLEDMTCTYYDIHQNEVIIEKIPG